QWASATLATFVLAGALAARPGPEPALPPHEPIPIEGTLSRPPERLEHGRTRVLVAAGATIAITTGHGEVDLLPGDRVRWAGRLHRPGGFANPDGLDAARSARARGIDYVAGVPDAAELVRVRADRGGPWRWAGALRARLSRTLRERVAP